MEARQRRIELRQQNTSKSMQKRCRKADSIDFDDDRSISSSSSKDNSTTSSFSVNDSQSKNKKQKVLNVTTSNEEANLSMFRGIKKQARYEPTIPISSKVELATWRKEARRIRNRESAAASRNKTRERIDELEGQLRTMQNQYSTALQRIAELESQRTSEVVVSPPQVFSPTDSLTNHVSPLLLPSIPTETPTELDIYTTLDEGIKKTVTEPLIWTRDHQSAAEALANSVFYDNIPSDNISIPNVVAPDHLPQVPQLSSIVSDVSISRKTAPSTSNNTLHTPHQDIKISRPTAVCVVPI